ncbi:MAG TPA: DUF6259 domain-containing protein [Arachidicoccus sp.]|nr:DUF6259 domain-containing protein [Arachidicoccus sp.]
MKSLIHEKFLNKLLITTMMLLSLRGISQQVVTIENRAIQLSIDRQGNLVSLKNLQTGFNYASGKPLWRLYFDNKEQKGNEVIAKGNTPEIIKNGTEISISYQSLVIGGEKLNISLFLKVVLEGDKFRFFSKLTNKELHTIVRELQYPLVGDCNLPADHKLLTTTLGGQLFPHPKKEILAVGNNPPYMGPGQLFRQKDIMYPRVVAANCFAFTGETQGLYFGSHDTSFQNTWHGLRLYPNENGDFDELEAGMYKYPNCLAGESWTCDANVIAPYMGNWHQSSKIYRSWANTWWRHESPPLWVQNMKSWQRIILRHQYGETFFKYEDLGNHIKQVGESVKAEAVFPFGWWNAGMDNGYPDSYFKTDPKQGGDAGWKKAVADFQKDGGKVLMYFNGKLIDKESAYYQNGEGKEVSYKNNTGTEYNEAYLFKANETFTGSLNSRSFVLADASHPKWQKMLLKMADRAIDFGANSVFYDQLGYVYADMNWDLTKEFPIPDRCVILDRANALKMIHQYIKAKDDNLALGTEGITDVTAQYVDYVHNLPGAATKNGFIEWMRYTFPEIIISDREIYDDTDIERRVNQTVLRGLRNDIDIYRCRDIIDKTPHYQQYLRKINQLKEKYSALLLRGVYRDCEKFTNENLKIEAKCFTNGSQLAVVLSQSVQGTAGTLISVPGYTFKESAGVGDIKVKNSAKDKQSVQLGKNGLAVLIYEQ